MSEFKGTKGLKLSTYKRGRDIYFNVFKLEGKAKEHDANLRLLNKSEEMLEELIKEVKCLKAMGLGNSERCVRKEKLIKEATEIK